MAWLFKYELFIQTDLVRAVLLQQLDGMKVTIVEDGHGGMVLRNTESFLYSKHPLTCLSKTTMQLVPLRDNYLSLQITGYPTQLTGYLIGGFILFTGLLLIVAHLILGSGWIDTLKSTISLIIMVLGGEIVLYLLIKEALRRYFDRLVDEIKGLTQPSV